MIRSEQAGPRTEQPAFTVLDETLIRKCIYVAPTGAEEDKKSRDRDANKTTQTQRVEFHEVACLIFSFTGISKIDNLVGFDCLTKLQLDNNNIEKIENLDHLQNLVWLDLSFNKIKVIEGLSELKKLEDLTLHCNEISKLEGMDELVSLKCFSIGKNQLADLEEVARYLRRFKALRMLSLAGNLGLAKTTNYEFKIYSHLGNLKYLDYRLVDPKSVQQAKAEHREHLVSVEEQDKKEEERQRQIRMQLEEEADLRACNCEGVSALFNELIEDGTEAKQITAFRESGVYDETGRLKEILNKYRETFDERQKELVTRMKEHKKTKDNEYNDFVGTLCVAKDEVDMECKSLIKQFEKVKKQVMPRHDGHPTEEEIKRTEENAEGVLKLRHQLKGLKEVLLEKETDQQEAYEAVISEFETNYITLQEETIETINECFKKLQDAEKEYKDELEVAFEEIRTRHQASVGQEPMSAGLAHDSARGGADWDQDLNSKRTQLESILENKEELDKLVDDSHNARTQKLYAKEERLTENEKASCVQLIEQEKEKEHQRNRGRICEIYMYCNLIDRLVAQELDEQDPYRDDKEYATTSPFGVNEG